MSIEFEDLTPEQVQLAAKLFWQVAKNFVYFAEPGMLVSFCLRCNTHEYAAFSSLCKEQFIECSAAELLSSAFDDCDSEFADFIKPLVLEKVQENFENGE